MMDEHDVFNVGDLVKTEKWTLLMRITKVTNKKVMVDVLNHTTLGFMLRDEFFKREIEHATEMEKNIGRRITQQT